MTKAALLRKLIEEPGIVVLPGAHDIQGHGVHQHRSHPEDAPVERYAGRQPEARPVGRARPFQRDCGELIRHDGLRSGAA